MIWIYVIDNQYQLTTKPIMSTKATTAAAVWKVLLLKRDASSLGGKIMSYPRASIKSNEDSPVSSPSSAEFLDFLFFLLNS
mgnify:CR=1 FL=1